jgi:hypothetical protein
VLSQHFESSVPGLYFVGPAAAATFGPLMRFAYGARYTAPQVARRLAATSVHLPQRRPDREELAKPHAAAAAS